MFPKRLFPQLLTSSAASLPASPSRGANRLSHLGSFGHLSIPQHRKRKPGSDRKLGRAAGPSGSTCALGHNGRALPPESADLPVSRSLHVVSLRLCFGGFGWWRCRDPSAGEARVVRFAPAVGFGLGAGSRGTRSTRSYSSAECSRPAGGTRDCAELQPKNW